MTPRKLHPLHTPEFILQQMQNTGCYADTLRHTGRSTAQALRFIAEAIENPHNPVRIVDHHGSRAASDHLCQQINSICNTLRLEHMQIRPAALTITFERALSRESASTANYVHALDAAIQNAMYRARGRM